MIIQAPAKPGLILDALEAGATPGVQEVRLAVAYVTMSGMELLTSMLEAQLGKAWPKVKKQLVTCVDFGLTDPEAIRAWLKQGNATAALHNATIKDAWLRPGRAFHAKYYELRQAGAATIVIGSANLTKAALTSNHEVASVTSLTGDLSSADQAWHTLTTGAVPATAAVLADYATRRAAIKIPVVSAVYVALPPPNARLWDAIKAGVAKPQDYAHFWVDTGSMTSGGSANQLEMPRGGHRFFGGTVIYNAKSNHIIDITMRSAGSAIDRPLSWHGSNKMERLNLPTGRKYAGRVVRFDRTASGFRLTVAAVDSPEAQSWTDRSEACGQRFKVGRSSPRRCGFF